MLSRLSFRAKLLLVLFVPFLALVVVAAAGLSDRFTALHAQQQYGDLSAPLRSLDDASRAIQDESVVSSWYVAGKGGPSDELALARSRTNAAVRVFRANEQAFAAAGLSEAASISLTAANRGLDDIPEMRGQVDATGIDAATTRDFYLGVDGHLLDFGERAARDLASSDVSASLTRVFALQRAQHEMAREASVYIAVLASGAPQDFSEWIGAQTSVARYGQLFTNTATADELSAFESEMGKSVMGAKAPPSALPGAFPAATLSPAAYYAEYQQQARQLDGAITGVVRVVDDTAGADASTALFDTRLYGGAAVFAMLLTLMLIWFVSNSLVGPLRRLTAAAREMSQRQLPALVESLRTGGEVGDIQPTLIEVTSEDEIGELAQAFNDVEAVTIEVAHEQSRLLRKGMGDLFVNLARRNQSLLERQLELLDELERNEHDPAALDALFKLDHMATRMRRNAESLLVLSGAEQPRQWQQPIALIDVVRAAAAEIADFPRVDLVGIEDDLAVSGRAVSDVAHLVAELLENATSFSPPDTAVVVSGAVTESGFVLAISDQGIGMPADRIAEANQLMAKPPLVGLALTRALGLHVVGSLAARHAIAVELRAGAPVGVVALVTLPTAVLEPRAVPAPHAPPPAPVYVPAVDEGGEPEPLGARRVAWRPSDEPPVEEWRREGLAESVATGPLIDDPSFTSFTSAPTAPAAPADDAPADDAPADDAPAYDPSGAPADPPGFNDQVPLPTRVPGQHLTHQPASGREEVDVDDDPMRPYRVHELLTRHAQGKRRGRADQDATVGDQNHVQEDGR